jgi:hypothetical protein
MADVRCETIALEAAQARGKHWRLEFLISLGNISMHISHRPFLPVWTPPAPAAKTPPDTAEFVEIARIAEDLGGGGKWGRFKREPGRGRLRQTRNESGARAAAKNSPDTATWSPASIATFDFTTIGATNAEPHADSHKDVGNLLMDAPENELSLDDLLARIVSAD